MIVVDTCVVIWLGTDPTALSTIASEVIADARKGTGVAIAGVTLYEIALLSTLKRIELAMGLSRFLAQVEENFVILPITVSIAKLAAELPSAYPSDPMDRIIGATALDLGVPLITPDRAIHRSTAVAVVW